MRNHPLMFAGVLAISALVFAATAALGSDEKRAAHYEKQFEKWTSDIAKLRKTDASGIGVEAIERIRTQVGKAQALSAAEKFEQIAPLEQRITVDLAFAQAWIERVNTEAAAEAAEARATEAEAAALEVKKKADAAKTKADQLEGKGL